MKVKGARKKVKIPDDLRQALSDALDYRRKENRVARQPVAFSTQAAEPQPDPRDPAVIQCEPGRLRRIINVSVNAVESWEQGVGRPREATLKLLTIAHKHPETLLASE